MNLKNITNSVIEWNVHNLNLYVYIYEDMISTTTEKHDKFTLKACYRAIFEYTQLHVPIKLITILFSICKCALISKIYAQNKGHQAQPRELSSQ